MVLRDRARLIVGSIGLGLALLGLGLFIEQMLHSLSAGRLERVPVRAVLSEPAVQRTIPPVAVEWLQPGEASARRYYVLKTQDEALLNFWTVDLHWAFAAGERDSKVAARVDKPIPWFMWPLEVGRRWGHQARYEDRSGRRQANDTFMVMGLEMIDVPAGGFNAMKVVREGQWAGPDHDR